MQTIKLLCFYIMIILLLLSGMFCIEKEYLFPSATPTPTEVLHILNKIGDYPRLTSGPLDLPTLRTRISNSDYEILYNRLISSAQRDPYDLSDEDYIASLGYHNGNFAKACVMLYLLEENESYAEKAKNILMTSYTDFTTTFSKQSTDSVHTSSAIIAFCQAYDLLLSTEYLSETDKQTISQRLISWIQDFYEYFNGSSSSYLKFTANNHNIIIPSAIGVAGILFSDQEQSRDWISFATVNIAYYLDLLINEEGGYGEGFYYAHYSALHYLPFIIPYNRWIEGEMGYYQNHCSTLLEEDCDPDIIIEVADFIGWEKLKNHFDMQVKLRFPNGIKPPFEDAYTYGWFGAIISHLYDDPVQLWDWENQAEDFEGSSGIIPDYSYWTLDLTAETFIYYNANHAKHPPNDGPSYFMPDSSLAVLRSGWDTEDIYLMALGEKGIMRGWSHEHIDDFSFQIFAFDNYLAIDSGYIKYDEAYKVNQAENHNTILIDGKGPPVSMPVPPPLFENTFNADMNNWISNTHFQHFEISGIYQETEVCRKIMFVHNQYFIIEDTLSSTQTHDYAFYLHLNGGGDARGTFNLTNNGTILQMPNGVSLEMAIANTAGVLNIEEQQKIHGWNYNQEPLHSVLVAIIQSDHCKFLTLLVPLDSGKTITINPVNTGLSNTCAWKIESSDHSYRDLIISRRDAGSSFNLDLQAEGFIDGIESTGDFLLISVDKNNPEQENFHYVDNDEDFSY